MSFDVDWDIEKYRDEHESEDHWQLRREFMIKWKNNYPEQRLICLARVFTNVELLGCRYPPEVMHEIARLSVEVAASYRKAKKSMLQRTFVSASDAAEDRAKGIKRKGGIIIDDQPKAKIQFVAAGTADDNDNINDEDATEVNDSHNDTIEENEPVVEENEPVVEEPTIERDTSMDPHNYLEEMMQMDCLNVRQFRDSMFQSIFGRMVLLIRPWGKKLWNMKTSCQVCNIVLDITYENRCMTMTINDQVIAQGTADSKVEAKSIVEKLAWERLREEVVSIVVKEQFIPQNDTRITVNDVSGNKMRDDAFGTPVENSVAMKMMQMMGWKGGGLGAEAQGIAEPIKPNMQLVNRAGLGSTSSDIRQLRKAAFGFMERYIASETLDLDLVFSSEFSKEERALLHQCAKRMGLMSRSYGGKDRKAAFRFMERYKASETLDLDLVFSKEERALLHQCAKRMGLMSRSYGGKDRFLVVKKKLDPFSLARAVIEKGGTTPKYQIFIPAKLAHRNWSN